MNPSFSERIQSFKARLKQMLKQRAEFRATANILDLKQRNCDIHGYAKHTQQF